MTNQLAQTAFAALLTSLDVHGAFPSGLDALNATADMVAETRNVDRGELVATMRGILRDDTLRGMLFDMKAAA